MSDLIERLELAEKRLRQYPPDAGFCTEVSFDVTEVRSILSALKTVRGIEGLAKGGQLSIFAPDEESGPEWWVCPHAKGISKAATLAAAVEAAGKKQ